MEPASKKRKLAPKPPSPSPQPPQPLLPLLPYPASATAADTHSPSSYANHDRHQHTSNDSHSHSHSHRAEFEAFARHLQDAAMLLQRHSDPSPSPYTDVSVLLLSWEHDTAVDSEAIASLEHTLKSDYNYHTSSWQIPAVRNPSIKLGVQMASFLEQARPNHLLIIYYAGRAYVGCDSNLYWACNARDDAAKLRWDGVRCLFEDAQSDILLLLDACSVPESIPESSHGVKQVIAASSPSSSDTSSPASPASPAKPNPPGFFTRCLVDAFSRLCDRPFTTQRLHEELADLLHSSGHRHSPLSPSQKALPNQAPLFFSLTSANNKTLTLSPLSRPSTSQPDRDASSPSPLEGLIDRAAISKLRFDSARVLACTTFVGDASPGMSAFHQWLQDVPSHASGIALEAMFLGPPTMLLISMPTSVWNAVQHDKVCCFLGYVSSHNMLQLYETLVGPSSLSSSAAVQDGKSLVHMREAASGSPHRYGIDAQKANVRSADTPSSDHLSSPSGRLYQSIAANSLNIKPRDNPNQDSAEMQEAAEQLKALSHVHHRSDDSPSQSQNRTSLIDTIPDGTRRRSLPKQETSCMHCSHAPFRDSSSLRKHIAAHHTRPFPCAFSFAGCSSTFGSKNEWKRHMASQHLCLQYYRCSACPQTGANPASSSSASTTDGKSNEFNRKDLFTQHLRRMHAPFQVKRATAATAKSDADAALHSEWDAQVKAMQKECLVTRRRPPQKAKCPKPGCEGRFEGAAAWDEWTEHVGRHMEKGEADDLEVDNLLTTWALVEGIIEPTGSADSDSFRLRAAPTPGSSQPVESQGTQESLTPWGKSFASSQMQSQSQSSQMRAPSPS